jgi:hypothetical protein
MQVVFDNSQAGQQDSVGRQFYSSTLSSSSSPSAPPPLLSRPHPLEQMQGPLRTGVRHGYTSFEGGQSSVLVLLVLLVLLVQMVQMVLQILMVLLTMTVMMTTQGVSAFFQWRDVAKALYSGRYPTNQVPLKGMLGSTPSASLRPGSSLASSTFPVSTSATIT